MFAPKTLLHPLLNNLDSYVIFSRVIKTMNLAVSTVEISRDFAQIISDLAPSNIS